MQSDSARGLVMVVEDEQAIAELLRLYLAREGFTVHVATDGNAALQDIRRLHPLAVVMDVGLPGIDGTEVCRRLRAEADWTPILFCTARDDEVDRVLGLEMGGDDYITKPFSPREVVARVKVALRRSAAASSGPTLAVGRVTLDRRSRRVTADGAPVNLTATEFDLLDHLLSHPGRVFTRDELLTQVWGYASLVNTRTVDVHVAQVRAKLGAASPIRTVRGVGYSAEHG
jgi:DNA-binding response OmpR family regulator